MRVLISLLLLCFILQSPVLAKYRTYTIDDFEDGDLIEKPEWWIFGKAQLGIDRVVASENPTYVGQRVLQVRGKSSDWFVGGLGTYLGLNGYRYNAFKVYVKGYGEESGSLRFEFYDDDNGNWRVEADDFMKNPIHDDKFIYTLHVDWKGWRTIIIPLSHFRDENPNIGDNIWNPWQRKNSGGIIQLQILAMTATEKGAVMIDIDAPKLFYGTKDVITDVPYLSPIERIISTEELFF